MSGSRRIDVHHHIIPKEYSDALAKKGIVKSLGMSIPHWNAEETVAFMDANNIGAAMVSISAPGVHFKNMPDAPQFARDLAKQVNEYAAQLIQDHPQRFGAFATLPLPDIGNSLHEIEYALDVLKLDGVVLMSNYDGRYLGDPIFEEILAELNRRNAVVFIHPDTPPGLEEIKLRIPAYAMEVCFDTTRTAYSLILSGMTEKYPDIRFILSHAGGVVPYLAARMRLIKHAMPEIAPRIPQSVKYYLRKFYYDTALSAYPSTFACLKELVGTKQMLFGSDYIFAPKQITPLSIKEIMDYEGFNNMEINAIEQGNALKLFPRFA